MGANKQLKTDVRGRDAQGGLLGTRISKGLQYFVTKETRYLMSNGNLEFRKYLVTRKKKEKEITRQIRYVVTLYRRISKNVSFLIYLHI